MIFTTFLEAIFFALKPDMNAPKNELQSSFEPAAAPPPERVTVTLDLDADLVAWLKEQPTGWQQEINNTSLIRELAFEEAAGLHELETVEPAPA